MEDLENKLQIKAWWYLGKYFLELIPDSQDFKVKWKVSCRLL